MVKDLFKESLKNAIYLLSHLWTLSLDGCPREVHTTYRQRVTRTRCPARQMCHLNLQVPVLTIPTVQGCKGKESKRKATMYETTVVCHTSMAHFIVFCWNWNYNLDCKVICQTSANTSTCRFEHLLSNQAVLHQGEVRLLKSDSKRRPDPGRIPKSPRRSLAAPWNEIPISISDLTFSYLQCFEEGAHLFLELRDCREVVCSGYGYNPVILLHSTKRRGFHYPLNKDCGLHGI